MNLELVVIVAVVAVVGLVGLAIVLRAGSARRASRGDAAGPPGPLEGAADVIDRSIGMYAVRRLTGRPTAPHPEAPRAMTEPPRVRETDRPGPRVIVAKVETYGSPGEPAEAIGHDTPRDPTSALHPTSGDYRERLIRDSGYALLTLVAIVLVVSFLIPGGFGHQPLGGGVAGETNVPQSPAQTGSSASQPAAASVVPSLRSAPAGAGTATPTLVPTPTPTLHVTPRPTLPNATHRPTPSPTPTPMSTSTSTPPPTPVGSSTPLPSPTPISTGTPTSTPPPSSTPTTTPSPAPTPTGAPTPTPAASP